MTKEPARSEREIAVRVEGVCKAYRSGTQTTPVLKEVDLRIARGECVFLAGPSGSGKSTLLSILACVLTPDSGQVEVLGEDVSRFNSHQQALFRRARIGIVFQKFHLFPGLNAAENVGVPLTLAGVPVDEVQSRSRELLEAVGLADKSRNQIWQLSIGQRQRVALARALSASPELILADEPTASLDAESGRKSMILLRQLVRERGATAVVVTHDARVFEFADRVLHLEGGRIV